MVFNVAEIASARASSTKSLTISLRVAGPLVFDMELYQMLSENLNRLHLPATHHPPVSLFLPKNITNLLGMISF